MGEVVIRLHEGDVGHLLDAVAQSRDIARFWISSLLASDPEKDLAVLRIAAYHRIEAAARDYERPGRHPALFEIEAGTDG